jgi:hypothetical protein
MRCYSSIERRESMEFEKAKQEAIRLSGAGIRRPSWKDKTLRITGDKQFAGARVIPKGKENTSITQIANDIQRKKEKIYDGSDLFYKTDKAGYSDGGVCNNKELKLGFDGEGLPYGKEDYMAKDWEVYKENIS